jgi:serine/threonine protein kinase
MDIVPDGIDSHYELLGKLGAGGLGDIYRALDRDSGSEVGLRFIPNPVRGREADAELFLQDVRVASSIRHPNVCAIFSSGEVQGVRFVTMELVEGSTLRAMIPAAGMNLKKAIGYAIQIGEGLQQIHDRRIVHWGIKSENVMVNPRGQAKIMDTGLSRLSWLQSPRIVSTSIRSLAFASPEVLVEKGDHRSDIFSFGAVLFELLTGRTPFRGEDMLTLAHAILHEAPDSVLKYRPDLPLKLDGIIRRAMEKNPEDRYQTVKALQIDLREVPKIY